MERAGSSAALTTNVFALCELTSLEWHVYCPETPSPRASQEKAKKDANDGAAHAALHQGDALTVHFQRLQRRNALCVLETEPPSTPDSSSLWLFVVNGVQSGVSTAPPAGVRETESGVWSSNAQLLPEVLSGRIQRRLLSALAACTTRKLTAQSEFLRDSDGFFTPNDAKFVFRCPSLTQLNHTDVYLEEEVPTPAFRLHFHLLHPSNLLAVTLDVVKQQSGLSALDEELGDPRASWERLLGLPSRQDHSVVDVWHLDDGLVPRIVANTKYGDVVPWFRSVSKRRHKRRMDDSDGCLGNEDDAAKQENEDDAEDEEEDGGQDADMESDELLRRGLAGSGSARKKRKRSSMDPGENDDSITPVSPDTHVNTPDTSGPVVRMTFPHDTELHLRVDPDVRRFKRRRNGSSAKKAKEPALSLSFESSTPNGNARALKQLSTTTLSSSMLGNGANYAGLSPSQLYSLAKASLAKPEPTSMKPKKTRKPTLSVAVSLVESLSHNEQQEALDGRPVKTHPLLQALQDYVDEETTIKLEASIAKEVPTKVKLLPNAEGYIPTQPRECGTLLAINDATAEQLRLRLYSDRFAHWKSEYKKLRYPKKSRQQKKDHQRQLVLDFDEASFLENAREQAVKAASDPERFALRDREIALGVQLAASGALVGWRQEPKAISAWSTHANLDVETASWSEKQSMVDRVQPYLHNLASSLTAKSDDPAVGHRSRQWLSFQDYTRASTASTKASDGDLSQRIEAVRLEQSPKLCVATLESSYEVEPPLLSEYLLRDLHPVAAPKPVDYVLVCPQSPSQWLGSLALSYLACFRSMYAQCHMGDHAPVDLSQLEGNAYAKVDASNALVLLECAESMQDAFANFRAAGELLRPVLSAGTTKKQAFSRSAVGNVVYLVLPFRRSDMKHKMWALGAFSHGLFGSEATEPNVWKGGVTVEAVYLDDLYEVEVNPTPHALLGSCFGLYDRVCESVTLKPAEGASGPGHTRFLSERLYHLADWRVETAAKLTETGPAFVYGGYLLSEDGKWLACSCTDAVGSVLETYMIPVKAVDDGLEDALVAMMNKFLPFFALFGEKTTLVITRLAGMAKVSVMSDHERQAWGHLQSQRAEELFPTKYATLVSRLLLVQLSTVPCEDVQFRGEPSSTLYVEETLGFAVISPHDRAQWQSRENSRAVLCTGSDAWKTTSLLHDQHVLDGKKEPVVLKLSFVRDLLQALEGSDGSNVMPKAVVTAILRDFHALSYLTMHPTTMERQSPLPLHLAAIAKLDCELKLLHVQLTTDPLQLR